MSQSTQEFLRSALGGPELVYAESKIAEAFPGDDALQAGKTFDDWFPESRGCLLCITPRSGSTYLARLLESTGRINMVREFMNHEDYAQNSKEIIANLTKTRAHDDEVFKSGFTSFSSYIRGAIEAAQTVENAFAVKGDLYQYLPMFSRGWLRPNLRNVTFIYVTREDVLMQAISLYRAVHSGAWNSDQPIQQRPEYDRDGILAQLEYLTKMMGRWELLFSILGMQPLRMNYEQISRDPIAAVRKVATNVGLGGTLEVGKISLRRQRDAESELWAARFRAETEPALRKLHLLR